MEERRQYSRLALMTEIWLGQDGIFTRTNETLADLSENGAFIETSQRYPVGAVLSLRFRLPGVQDFISCAVIIRHTKGGTGLGVEFLDLIPEDRQQIRTFLERQRAVSRPAL
ncbi:MAG TPA: PilZ domain-containing protein [Blastocatellia bacterium]|nr:PilZ domain-containing protein [Blastocatellia bacterium]